MSWFVSQCVFCALSRAHAKSPGRSIRARFCASFSVQCEQYLCAFLLVCNVGERNIRETECGTEWSFRGANSRWCFPCSSLQARGTQCERPPMRSMLQQLALVSCGLSCLVTAVAADKAPLTCPKHANARTCVTLLEDNM